MTNDDLLEFRAALMQYENSLETQRACVIRIRKVIERQLGIEAKSVKIVPNSTIAGAVGNTVTTT